MWSLLVFFSCRRGPLPVPQNVPGMPPRQTSGEPMSGGSPRLNYWKFEVRGKKRILLKGACIGILQSYHFSSSKILLLAYSLSKTFSYKNDKRNFIERSSAYKNGLSWITRTAELRCCVISLRLHRDTTTEVIAV